MVLNAPVALPLAPDLALVERAQDGDEAAFSAVYHQYWRMVHGILLARVPRDEVDDLAQDVFLNAYRQLRGLREAAAFPGWLARIARNRACDYHRRAAEIVELPEDLAVDDAPEAEARQALAAIRSLPDAYRETLVLRLVEGLSGAEIAERTGLTAASVRVNLHRGMKLLRDQLERRPDRV